jgi:hypothetical protein
MLANDVVINADLSHEERSVAPPAAWSGTARKSGQRIKDVAAETLVNRLSSSYPNLEV